MPLTSAKGVLVFSSNIKRCFLKATPFCICLLAMLLWLPITKYSNVRRQSSVGSLVKYHCKDDWFHKIFHFLEKREKNLCQFLLSLLGSVNKFAFTCQRWHIA